MSPDELRALARRVDFCQGCVAVTTSFGEPVPQRLVETLKSANPNLKILGYAGSFDMGFLGGEGLLGDASDHPEWRLRSREGHPLMGYFDGPDGTPTRWVFDPGRFDPTDPNGSFRQFLLDQILADLERYQRPDGSLGLDGVLLDQAFQTMTRSTIFRPDADGHPALMWYEGDNADGRLYRPWNPRTGDYYTDADWARDIRDTVAYVSRGVHALYPAALVLVNGLSWFADSSYAGGVAGACPAPTCGDQASLLDIADGPDGVMIEQFLSAHWNLPGQWYTNWDWTVTQLARLSSRGKIVLAVSGVNSDDRAVQQKTNMFTYASFLLGAAGSTSAYDFTNWDQDPNSDVWPGVANSQIGEPVGADELLHNGLHRRVFRNGLVLVNPGWADVQYDLGRQMYRLNDDGTWGSAPVRVVLLSGHSGMILRG